MRVGLIQSVEGQNRIKRLTPKKEGIPYDPNVGFFIEVILQRKTSALLVSSLLAFRLELTPPALLGLLLADSPEILGLVSLHNQVSSFLIINLLLCNTYIYTLLVLFLWRTLNNTDLASYSVSLFAK